MEHIWGKCRACLKECKDMHLLFLKYDGITTLAKMLEKVLGVMHRRIHTNPREEICEVCGQRFNTRDNLKIHYKLKHIQSKEFQCNLCGSAFALKSSLAKHIERHNPDRQRMYSCNLCAASYRNKYTLSRHHIIKHTAFENRPSCEISSRRYTKKIDLVKHINKHRTQNSESRETFVTTNNIVMLLKVL